MGHLNQGEGETFFTINNIMGKYATLFSIATGFEPTTT